MAPKLWATKVMKRPASASSSRRRVINNSTKATRAQKASRSRAIFTVLKNVEGLPTKLRSDLAKLVERRVSDKKIEAGSTAALGELRHTLRDVEDKILASLEKAQEVVDGSGKDKFDRDDAQRIALAEVMKLKQALVDGKSSIKNSSRSVQDAREAVDNAEISYKKCGKVLSDLRSKLEFLVNTETKTYAPLKLAPVAGTKGQKQLKSLCKVGKDNGFHEVLLNTVPVILKKQLDKRRTFDGLAIQQLDKEFAKLRNKLEHEVAEADASLNRQSVLLQTAKEALEVAEAQQQDSTQVLAETENALVHAKATLCESRKRVHQFKFDARQAERILKDTQKQLASFRKGPLAALGELQTILTPADKDSTAKTSAHSLLAPSIAALPGEAQVYFSSYKSPADAATIAEENDPSFSAASPAAMPASALAYFAAPDKASSLVAALPEHIQSNLLSSTAPADRSATAETLVQSSVSTSPGPLPTNALSAVSCCTTTFPTA